MQRFETRGLAPSRTSGAGFVGASAGVSIGLGPRIHAGGELAAQTHFFSIEDQAGSHSVVARFALRAVLGFGGWF
jgi:hypothetical protein